MPVVTRPYYFYGRVAGRERVIPTETVIHFTSQTKDQTNLVAQNIFLMVLSSDKVGVFRRSNLTDLMETPEYEREQINTQEFKTGPDCLTRTWTIYWRE